MWSAWLCLVLASLLTLELHSLFPTLFQRECVVSSLELKYGLNAKDRFDVFYQGEFEVLESVKDRQSTTFTRGLLTQWTFLAIRSVVRETRNARLILLRPGADEPFELHHFDFYAKGDAHVVHRINAARQVNELWKQRKKLDWSTFQP